MAGNLFCKNRFCVHGRELLCKLILCSGQEISSVRIVFVFMAGNSPVKTIFVFMTGKLLCRNCFCIRGGSLLCKNYFCIYYGKLRLVQESRYLKLY